MRRHAPFTVLALFVVLALALAPTPREPAEATDAFDIAPRSVPPSRSSPAEDHAPVDAADFQRGFRTRTRAVAEACDLRLETQCDGRRCAAVVASPNLDHALGWLRILRDRPGLVASTVLRDAGIDPGHLPCGRALDRLGEQPIYSVADPDSTGEWWCTPEAADPEVDAASLCDQIVARRRGAPFEEFTTTTPRRLHFRPPTP